MKKLAVVSLSGGMDSTSLATRLLSQGYRVLAISFDYGQKHKVEIERAESFCKFMQENNQPINFHKVDLTSVGVLLQSSLIGDEEVPQGHYEDDNMKSTVVPNRNVIFSSIVYGIALSLAIRENSNVEIALGVHAGDHTVYLDCRQESIDALRHAFAISNWDSEKVTYTTPYVDLNKTDVLADGISACNKLGVDWQEVYKNTITSYDPDANGKSNGKTGSDVERVEAFCNLGLVDPVEYVGGWNSAVDFMNQQLGR